MRIIVIFIMINLIIFCRDAIAFDKIHLKNLKKSNKCNHCNFHQSNFSKIDLRNAQLKYTDFSDSNLRSSDFRGAILINANFKNSDLTAARF